MNQVEPKTITVSQAALMLGISRGSAYEATRTGQLPAIRIGKRWLIPVKALEQMLESTSTGSVTL